MIIPHPLILFTHRIVQGWWAIFREVKRAFILFGVLHTFLLVLWPGMFANPIFRYTFKAWSFFACVSVTSYLFVVATAIMAVICRLHFGRGLGHFCKFSLSSSPMHVTTRSSYCVLDCSKGGVRFEFKRVPCFLLHGRHGESSWRIAGDI